MKLNTVNLFVRDQDEALAFYTEKVGLVVQTDITVAEMGNFRWLTVQAPEQDVSIALMAIPGPPMFEAEITEQVTNLMSKGYNGGLFFGTEDCQADYETLKGRGVTFTQEPTQVPYGVEAVFVDPSGNTSRLVQAPSA